MKCTVREMSELVDATPVIVLLVRVLAQPIVFGVFKSQDPGPACVQVVARVVFAMPLNQASNQRLGRAFMIGGIRGI